MKTRRFPEQKEELEKLLAASGLSDEELSRLAVIKLQTFRKYAGGYQKAGERTLEQIRRLAQEAASSQEIEIKTLPQIASKMVCKIDSINPHDDLSRIVDIFTDGQSTPQIAKALEKVVKCGSIDSRTRERVVAALSRRLNETLKK